MPTVVSHTMHCLMMAHVLKNGGGGEGGGGGGGCHQSSLNGGGNLDIQASPQRV